jgi:outer membrane protein assembly factor BamB
LAVDSQGGVVAVGTVTAPVTPDGVSLTPREGATPFVLRLDAQGHVSSGAVVDALPHGDAWLLVATGPGDDVTVAGPADGGGGSFRENAPVGAPFVARVSMTGVVRWTRPLPGQRVTGLAVAPDGAIAFAGILKEPAGTETAVVARWSADGESIWQKTLGDLAPEGNVHWPALVRGVAVDSAGAVVVVGSVEPWGPNIGHLDLGQGPVNPHGESGFVAKFSPAGQVLWSRGITYSEPYAVTVGGDTLAMVGDARCGSADIAPFVMAVDAATGAERWARWMPREGLKRMSAGRVAVTTDGTVAFTEWGGNAQVLVGGVDRSPATAWSRLLYTGNDGPAPRPPLVWAPSGLVVLPTRDRPRKDIGRVIGLVK